MNKKIRETIFILTVLCILSIISASALAYDTVTYSFQDKDSMTINNVNVLAYDCLDATCTTYDDFSGILPSGSTTTGQLIVKYPAELATPYGYAMFFTSQSYLPKEGVSTRHCLEGAPECIGSGTITLNKLENCSSTIDSFTVTNDAHAYIPLTINTQASLDATTYSAFQDADTAVGFTPDSLKDEYYSSDIRVTLEINKGTTPEHSDTKEYTKDSGDAGQPLYMDTAQDVEFTWTPTTDGAYTATITTHVIDNQCSSTIDQSASDSFSVLEALSTNTCYTILNNLQFSDPWPIVGNEQTVTFTKISNYVTDYESEYLEDTLTPVSTAVTYTVKNNAGATVTTDTITIDANSDSTTPEQSSFTWTPADSGTHTVTVTGISNDALCSSHENIASQLQNTIYVNPIPSYSITFSITPSGVFVDMGSKSGTTNTAGLLTLSGFTSGTYTYTASKLGYETKTGNVEITNVDKTVAFSMQVTNTAPYICGLPDRTLVQGTSDTSIDLDDYVIDDTDADSALTWTFTGNSDISVSINPSTHMLTLTASATGTDYEDITFTAADPKGLTGSDTLRVTITPSNTPPTLNTLPDQTLDEDNHIFDAFNLNTYASDTETADKNLIYAITGNTDPQVGVSIDSKDNIDIQPTLLNWYGSSTVTITVTDEGGLTTSGSFLITVNPVNDAPEITGVTTPIVIQENTIYTLDLKPFEYDIEDLGTWLVWSISGVDTALYTATIDGDDILTITPKTDQVGTDTATLTLTDSGGLTDMQDITIDIEEVPNTPPSISGLPDQALDEDSFIEDAFNLKAYAHDAETSDDNLIFTIVSSDPDANVSIDAEKNIDIYPTENWNGISLVTIQVTDDEGLIDTDNFAITVNQVNDAPVAYDSSIATDEDTPVNIALTATDVDGDSLEYTILSDPAHGTLSGTAPSLTYTPDDNYNGQDAFTFKVNDGTVDSNMATVTISIGSDNDAPVAEDIGAATDEDTQKQITLMATDADGDTLTYHILAQPDHGTATVSGNTATYTPNDNYNGPDSFTYRAYDGQEYSNTATVTITINPINDAPVAFDGTAATDEDTPISIALAATDIDGDSLEYTILSNPAHGTLSGTVPNLMYTPNQNYNGPDSFTFKVNDGTVDSNTATVSITINPINDAPVANEVSATTNEDTPVDITLSATDADCNSLTYYIVSDPAHGSVNLAGKTATYTPDDNYNGPDSFTYRAHDGEAYSNIATVSITINPINDAPYAMSIALTANEDTPVNITLEAIDIDDINLYYYIVSGPSNGTVTISNDIATYTPDLNFNGMDEFTYHAFDGEYYSNVALVSINVGAVNDAPVAEDISTATDEDTPVYIILEATDADGDSLEYEILSGPGEGTATVSEDTATYTPDDNYNGPDSFTYRAYDGQEYSNIATVTITVNPINDAPTAFNTIAMTDEDTPVSITIAAADIDGDTLEYIIISGPTNGIILGTAPNFIYAPNQNYNGADSFTFKVNDGTVDSNTATVSITINPVNDAPVANDVSATTDEDTPVNIILEATDADCNSLTYYIISDPAHGSVSLAGDTATYTPDDNYNGPDSFTYRAYDGQEYSNIATVMITVNPINDAPVAFDDSATTDEDVPVSITLTATDIDGDALTYTVVSNPSHGTLSGIAPYLTYTPDTNYNGLDSFTFKVNDGTVDSNTATVAISIGSDNDAPVAEDISTTTDEDTPIDITLSATDADCNSLTYYIVSDPAHGSVSLAEDTATYTPNTNYNGPDSFTYRAFDGQAYSNIATVSITINPINDVPVAYDDSINTDEDNPVNIPLTATDADGDSLEYIILTGLAHGYLSGTAPYLTYIPDENYYGPDAFTFKVNDGTVDSNTATFTINIDSVNDLPYALGITLGADEDTPVNITLEAIDVDDSELQYYIVSGPSNGVVTISDDVATYTPDKDFNGLDEFTYHAFDGEDYGNVAPVTIDVDAVNDPPIASDDNITTDEDTPIGITLTATDIDGDSLEYSLVDDVAHGTLSGTIPNLIYTPNQNYNGPDSFTFKVNDGTVDSNIATVSITINPVNDAPVANDVSATTDEDTPIDITLSATDADCNSLTYNIVSNPTHGSVSLTGNTVTYTPDENYNGPDSFTYRAYDGQEYSNIATVSITVNPINDAPVAYDDDITTGEDTQIGIGLAATDIDGDSLEYTILSDPAHGTLSGTAPSLTYTPDTNYNGPDSFTFKVNDGTVDSNTATVTISIGSDNDAPVAEDIGAITDEDTQKLITLMATDADCDSLTYNIVSNPTHGSVSLTGNTVTYTPDENYNGPDSFTYRAYDGQAYSNIATVTITVSPINDAPVAFDETSMTNEDTILNITLEATDVDGDELYYYMVSDPSDGTVIINNNIATYTPDMNFNGLDSFTFKVNDGTVDSNTATVTITVISINDAPIADANGPYTGYVNETVQFLGTATDVDGTVESYTWDFDNDGEIDSIEQNPTYAYTQTGTYTVIFSATDNQGATSYDTTTANITINPNPILSIEATSAVELDQGNNFTVTATLRNSGGSSAIGTLTISVPEGLEPDGTFTQNIDIPALSEQTFTWDIEAAMWGNYQIGLDTLYNGTKTANATVDVTVHKAPIFDFRIAAPDSLTIGDTTDVLVGIYNTGAENGSTDISISGDGHIDIIGDTTVSDVFIEANTTEQDAVWQAFTITGTSAGTGIISVTVNGVTKTKEIEIRSTPIRIDLSVSAIAPTEISLYRSFEVRAIIYNTGNETSNDVDVTITLEDGLNFTGNPEIRDITENIPSIAPTVNGTQPLNLTWYVNGTMPGLHAITLFVEDNESNNASDTAYVNILDVPETHSPQLTFEIDDMTLLIGQTATGTVTVTNTGDLAAVSPEINLIYSLGIDIAYDTTPGDFDINETKTFGWNVTAITVGDYIVSIHAYDTEGFIIGSGSFDVHVIADTEDPVINSVTLNNDIFKKTQLIHVTVNATDNSGILEIYADEVLLTNTADGIWEGDISPNQTLGTHNLTVIARDLSGNTATDTSAQYTVIDDETAPEPPTGIVAIALSDDTIRLSWISSASDDVKYYSIYSSEIEGVYDFGSPAVAAEPDTNMINITGLAENTTYYFVMKSVDNVYNEGNASEEASATTLMDGESNDPDGDRLPTDWENHYNQTGNLLDPDNNDSDNDSITDDLEDPDSDSLNNYEEYVLGTDPNSNDTDNDTMPDGWEVDNGLNPTDPKDGALDADSDGLSNADEYLHGTDPNNPDTDGDGYTDGWEIDNNTNPLDINDPTCHINCGGSTSSSRGGGGTPPVEIIIIENETDDALGNGTIYVSKIDLPDTAYIGQTITIKGCLIDPESDTIDFMIDFGIVESLTLDGNGCFLIEYKVDLKEGKHNFAIVQGDETLYSKDVLVYEYSISREYIAGIEDKGEPEPVQGPTGLLTWVEGSFNMIVYFLILLIIIAVYLRKEAIRATVIRYRAK